MQTASTCNTYCASHNNTKTLCQYQNICIKQSNNKIKDEKKATRIYNA